MRSDDIFAPISDELAYQHKCPRCFAAIGDSCVYTFPTQYGQPNYAPSVQDKRDRVGQPCRTHNQRRDIARAARERRYYRERREALRKIPPVPPAVADRVRIRTLHNEFDRQEEVSLIFWLLNYSGILTGTGSTDDA